MPWTNYRDLSEANGFQFEFVCESCGTTWRSPYKAYRAGQAANLLQKAVYMFGDVFSSFNKARFLFGEVYKVARAGSAVSGAGSNKAHDHALAEAMTLADQRYHRCPNCKKQVGDECWSEDARLCTTCERDQASAAGHGGGGAAAGAIACPNCQTPSQGGRFCHECGFDMASTHKSCPSCGATQPRSARFCGDCGHGF